MTGDGQLADKHNKEETELKITRQRMINNLKREIANVVIFLYKDSAGDESSDR